LQQEFQTTPGACDNFDAETCFNNCSTDSPTGFPYPDCAEYQAQMTCFNNADEWICDSGNVYADFANCGDEQGAVVACFPQ
jgi:hypothetical protein